MNTEHPAAVSEHQILEALRRVPQERWGAVLRFLADQEEGRASPRSSIPPTRWLGN